MRYCYLIIGILAGSMAVPTGIIVVLLFPIAICWPDVWAVELPLIILFLIFWRVAEKSIGIYRGDEEYCLRYDRSRGRYYNISTGKYEV